MSINETEINNIDDFPFGKPLSEMDMPINNSCGEQCAPTVEVQKLKYEDFLAEQDKDRDERKYYKAFNLIFICLGALVFLYVFDYISFGITGKTNENMSSIIEALKALLFSLSGYLFAERQKK